MLHNPKQAIIVDSEAIVLTDLEDMLGELGYLCRGFTNALAVPAELVTTTSLAVLDWQTETHTLADELTARRVPVILTSTTPDGVPTGSMVLHKPYMREQLVQLVRTAATGGL